MKAWTPHHAALLGALRGERLVPKLYKRLSLERYEASEEEINQLGDWPNALTREPGWAILEPALDTVGSWPAVWHSAIEAGFSPVCDHHHALIFERLTHAFLKDQEFEHAQWAWTQCLGAWKRLFSSDYPKQLLAALVPDEEVTEDIVKTRHKVLHTLLVHLVQRHMDTLYETLRIDDDTILDEVLDRRRIRAAWTALELVDVLFEHSTDKHSTDKHNTDKHSTDPFGTLSHTRQYARIVRAELVSGAVARFERMITELDLSTAQGANLMHPFHWVAQVFELLGDHEHASIMVVRQVVELGWTLRRTGREDEIQDFPKVLATTHRFNTDLQRRLARDEIFGHNAKCADFFVFQGELEDEHSARKKTFRAALTTCPGHRNSSMLLSYELLVEANQALTQASLIPAVTSTLPVTSRSAHELLGRAHTKIKEAEQVYAHNKELPEYKKRLERAQKRLHVTL